MRISVRRRLRRRCKCSKFEVWGLMFEVWCSKFEVWGLKLFLPEILYYGYDHKVWRFGNLEAGEEQAKEIYKLTKEGSFAKDFDLKNQINAAAGSAMDNIAEGFERFSNKEFSQFLIISKGSNGEVRSQLYRAFDRGHITEEVLKMRLDFSVMLGNKVKSFWITCNLQNIKANHGRRINIQHPISNIKLSHVQFTAFQRKNHQEVIQFMKDHPFIF